MGKRKSERQDLSSESSSCSSSSSDESENGLGMYTIYRHHNMFIYINIHLKKIVEYFGIEKKSRNKHSKKSKHKKSKKSKGILIVLLLTPFLPHHIYLHPVFRKVSFIGFVVFRKVSFIGFVSSSSSFYLACLVGE